MTSSPQCKKVFCLIWVGFLLLSVCFGIRLPQTYAQTSTPQITNVSIKNNSLAVKGRGFSTDAKIEVDGSLLSDTKGDSAAGKLKSKQGGTLSPGSYLVTVRNGDNQRSAPVIFDFQATQKPKVTLSITPATSLQVPVGSVLQLVATARDAAGGTLTGVAFSWNSSNSSVASVDSNGAIKGVSSGSARITVSALRNDLTVDVTVSGNSTGQAASIRLLPDSPVINEGGTLQLQAQVLDTQGNIIPNAPVTWSSDNETQVRVNDSGLLTAVKRGFAAITVKSGNAQIIVSAAAVRVEKGGTTDSGGPGEVRTDLANRVYVTDLAQHVIRRGEFGQPLAIFTGAVNARGQTDGGLLQARYNGPLGIGIDNKDGDLFIADTANQVIRQIDSRTGQVKTLAGMVGQAGFRDGPMNQALFNSPRGAVVGSDGNVYVADGLNHVLRVIDLRKGIVRTLAGSPGLRGLMDGTGSAARFNTPQGLALDTNDQNIVVADTENGRIRLVGLDGSVTTLGFLSKSNRGLAYNQWQDRDRLAELLKTRKKVQKRSTSPLADAEDQFDHPGTISVDGVGTLYVTDRLGVHVIIRSGEQAIDRLPLAENSSLGSVSGVTVTTVEGTFAGGNRATGILLNTQNDGKTELVRVTVGVPMINAITPESTSLTGGTLVTATGLNFTPDIQVFLDGEPVRQLKVDKSIQFTFITPPTVESGIRTLTVQGRGGTRQFPFYVLPPTVESLNTGAMTTVAGGTSFVGDGGDALNCTLAGPGGMVIDQNGDLLMIDRYNNRARRVDAQTNVITTFAGRGSLGNGGNDNPALSATLNSPEGIAIDENGNIFISDAGNFRVRVVDPQTGKISTYAGSSEGFSGDGGLATEAQLGRPAGLAVDVNRNLFIADPDNHRVRRVDAETQKITTVAGNGKQGFSGDGASATDASLNTPTDVAVDELGTLYIADQGNHRIRRVSPNGTISTIAGNGQPGTSRQITKQAQATSVSLFLPHSIELFNDEMLLIADTDNQCIRLLDLTTDMISTIAGQEGQAGFAGDGGDAETALFSEPSHLTVDGAGNIYVSDSLNNRIRRIDGADGTITTYVGTGNLDFLPEGSSGIFSRLYYPVGLQFDRQGNLYICEPDPGVGRVRFFNTETQNLFTFAGRFDLNEPTGGDGGPARNASLLSPTSTAIDPEGNVYIVDSFDGRIRRVDAKTGIIDAFAGNPDGKSDNGIPAKEALLDTPFGATFGPDGNFYFAEAGTHRIRRIVMSTRIIETVAGTGSEGFAGDGGPASIARLKAPTDVAFDRNGNLYIADAGNNRVRRVEAGSGIISTFAGGGPAENTGENLPATQASLSLPFALAVDGANQVVIVDQLNHRVRVVNQTTRLITTLAGNGSAGISGDGQAGTEASLFYPGDVAIDSKGNLLISDTFNNRIRLVKEVLTPPAK